MGGLADGACQPGVLPGKSKGTQGRHCYAAKKRRNTGKTASRRQRKDKEFRNDAMVTLVYGQARMVQLGISRHEVFDCFSQEFFWKACPLFGVDTPEGPPTPQTPLLVPPPNQKGYQSAPF